MINKKMLISEMALRGYNQRSLSKEINMSKNTFNLKINGKSEFNTDEIEDICRVLGITNPQKKCAIFLS